MRDFGKRHDHVMRDIRSMLDGLKINHPIFGGISPTKPNEAH